MPALDVRRLHELIYALHKAFPVNHAYARRLLQLVLAIAFGMIAFRAVADSQAPLELTADNLASVIDPLMTAWIDKRKGPGAVVVVVNRDGLLFAKGYGFADIEARKAFTADATLVRPGSISKLFTGIAVMQLVDGGRLDLDRDVNGYLDFAVPTPDGGVPVTLRRLLTHRAGFEEHLKGLISRDRAPELLGRFLAKSPPLRLFPNGDIEAYSNYGVALAGYIVERVSGEPFASYVQQHVLDPLGMNRSTFRQPLPDNLAPLMAKGYRTSEKWPLGFFEAVATPAGGLSATGTDMGRFIRALMNGGALDDARIIPKGRLDEMMAPSSLSPAGCLGLVFFGTKVAGHDSIGHAGATMAFSSDLTIFPEHGVGIFLSLDGTGEDMNETPDPVTVIAEHFLPRASGERSPEPANAHATASMSDARMAGIYHASRRAESSWMRFIDLASEIDVRIDSAGDARVSSAIWPFAPKTYRRVDRNLYQGPDGDRVAFIDDAGSESYLAAPAGRLQRVPWFLNVQWIGTALAASTAVVLLTVLAWPFAAFWRRWRKKRWGRDSGDRRRFLAVRLVSLINAVVIVAAVILFFTRFLDLSVLSDALDPLLLALYGLAWLGVFGTILTVWAASLFWRNGVGSRWSRIHHALIAASSVVLAWFFVTFHIAGTTLNY
jgi:CubicO group peptidase (beta-lactamase class C family)